MESISKIRRWVLVEGRSMRSVARATGLSRNTIKKYLKDESPPSYQRQAPPVRHKLCNGFDLRLQGLFEQDQKRPRRERRTAVRLYEPLVSKGIPGPVRRFSVLSAILSVPVPDRQMRSFPCILQPVMPSSLTGAKNALFWAMSSDR